MPKSLAAALAALLIAAVATSCSLEVQRASHVTAHAATLKAKVHCGALKQARKHRRHRAHRHVRPHGRIWLQLRRTGRHDWKRVTRKRHFSCAGHRKRVVVAKRVRGLRAGALYEYRLAIDPRRRGGRRVFSQLKRFRTVGTRPPALRDPAPLPSVKGFRPGLAGTADHPRTAVAAKEINSEPAQPRR